LENRVREKQDDGDSNNQQEKQDDKVRFNLGDRKDNRIANQLLKGQLKGNHDGINMKMREKKDQCNSH
jgi:hypothetical protein